MDIVFGYSDRIIALHQGTVLADATAGRDPPGRRAGGGGRRPAPCRRRSQGIWPLMLRRPRRRRLHPGEPHPAPRVARGARPGAWSAWSAGTARARRRRSARSWATSGPRGAGSSWTGPRSHGRRTHEIARLGARVRARGRRDLPRPHRRREHRDLDLDPARRPPRRRADRPRLRGVPACCAPTPRARDPTMSGGERKMLSIARALALDPRDAAARRALRGPLARHPPHGGPRHRRDRQRKAARSSSPSRTSTTCPPETHAPLRHRARRDHLRGAAGRRPAGSGGPARDRRRGHPLIRGDIPLVSPKTMI